MPLSFQRVPGPGETRACTDPWRFVIVRADGDVSLCCRSPAVGNLASSPLDAILEGEAARALRRGLLSAELPAYCRDCCERGVTDPASLRAEVERLHAEDDLEVVEELRAENRKLMQARADLLRERDALRGHASNLEAERPHLVGHIANLEAELARLRERLRDEEGRAR